METLIVGLLLMVLTAQGAVWYKLGKVESCLHGHLSGHDKEHKV